MTQLDQTPRRLHGATAAERAEATRPSDIRTGAMFSQVPLEALGDRFLLPIDKVILGLLASHDNGQYRCWPTNKTLAREAGCSLATVKRALARLQQLGWISVEPDSTVPRGQVILLNWRRPAPQPSPPPPPPRPDRRRGRSPATVGEVLGGLAGGHRRTGGRRTEASGRGAPASPPPKVDTARQGPEDPARAARGAPDPHAADPSPTLSPDELAYWEAQRTHPTHRFMAHWAERVLSAHAAAAATGAREPEMKRVGSGQSLTEHPEPTPESEFRRIPSKNTPQPHDRQ